MTETDRRAAGAQATAAAHAVPPEDDEAFSPSPATLVNGAMADGMETCLLQIECGYTRGFAGLQLLGNATEVCKDGKERARAALERLGLNIPPRRLVVSLTPADIKKDGNHLDLPIAVSLALLLREVTPQRAPARWMFAAELGLAGELRPVKGVVSFALAAMAAGLDGIVVATENLQELAVMSALRLQTAPDPADQPPGEGAPLPIKTLGFDSLAGVLAWLFEGDDERAVVVPPRVSGPPAEAYTPNFDDMILHPALERAALVACAGMHSLLLRGSPGTGKSMLASRLASILPPLGREEHLEAMRIYSCLSERLPPRLLAGRPPFRAPHHQASAAAILGGPESPGEMALAHGGVLFLDELPEFRRDLLESLREPLETGEIRVSRSRRKVIWKSRVILAAACNNCPCGWYGSKRRTCLCGRPRVMAYRARVSGPILERIDLHINVPEPTDQTAALFVDLAGSSEKSQTARLLAQVERARAFAAARNQDFGIVFNGDLKANQVLAASGLTEAAFSALVERVVPRTASSRSVMRSLRVARTLADLEESPVIRAADLEMAWGWQSEWAGEARGETLRGWRV